MMYLGESYRATAAYDRGLINDIYGLHSFEEDISKRIKQLSKGQIQVKFPNSDICCYHLWINAQSIVDPGPLRNMLP